MKILVVSATFPPMKSGGADVALALCQHLARAGNEVTVLTAQIPNVVSDPSLRVLPLMTQWGWGDLKTLIRVAKEVRPDVINLHFHGEIYNHQPMITLAPTILKQALPGVRFVTHIEWPMPILRRRTGLITQFRRFLMGLYVRAWDAPYNYGTILRDSDYIVILSETHRPPLLQCDLRAADKFVLIPPPATPCRHPESPAEARERGRAALGIPNDAFVVAYYGYLYPLKGLEELLKALHLLAPRRPELHLVAIGGGNEVLLKTLNRPNYVEELHQMARDLGVDGRVHWTGYVPSTSPEGSRYLRAADAAALLFDAGAFMNNSSIAAVTAHDLPFITTRAGIIESPFREGENLLLCPPKDVNCVAEAIDSLIASSELRNRLARGATELAREWFSWDTIVQRTLAAFRGRDDVEKTGGNLLSVSPVATLPQRNLCEAAYFAHRSAPVVPPWFLARWPWLLRVLGHHSAAFLLRLRGLLTRAQPKFNRAIVGAAWDLAEAHRRLTGSNGAQALANEVAALKRHCAELEKRLAALEGSLPEPEHSSCGLDEN